jgi:hypothetical protein
MKRTLVAIVMVLALIASASAQDGPAQSNSNDQVRAAPDAKAAEERAAREAVEQEQRSFVPLKVQVVLAKYHDGKMVSRLPYELTLASDNQVSSIRMMTEVPVVNASVFAGPNAPESINYRNVGTNIDGRVRPLDNGRYTVWLTIEDTSVLPGSVTGRDQRSAPTFRNYKSTNSVILRDGQSTQFTAASDKITGDELRAQVTLTVVK